MGRFDGKVVIVTGAGSGIGQAVAKQIASEGGNVAALDVTDGVDAVVAAITDAGGKATAYRCDVSDAAAVDATVAAVVAAQGPPSVTMNIAGIGKFVNTHESSIEDWNRIIAVNLTGTFLMCRATLPYLLENKGVIVNTASSAGVKGQPYSAAYSASKGGVALLTKALAVEYLAKGVRVVAIAPGGVSTNIMNSFTMPEGVDYSLMARITSPQGFMEADHIAKLFAFVASDDGDYMTGSVVVIDGGITA